MELLLPLWLPILLAAIAVWITSSIVWMALPHHKRDYIPIPTPPGEDAFINHIRQAAIPPGNYAFPDCHAPGAMKSERIQQAWKSGPIGHLTLWKTPLTMADKMVGTFLVYLIVTTLIAYLTRQAIPGPAAFRRVFKVATIAGVLAYCFATIPTGLWWGSYKRTIVANIIDGILYAVITGAILAWRWPG